MHAFGFFRRAAWLLVMVFPLLAGAQAWPGKPIKWIIPYPPGGITDSATRMVVQKVQEQTGWNIVVENKPGANSILGAELAARAAPDGYTFLTVIGAHAANATLYAGRLPYDVVKSFAPVSLVGVAPLLMTVNNNLPVKDVKELIAYTKANPGKVSFGSSGVGAAAHLTQELFKQVSGADMVHVPYKGTAPALNDLMGGSLQILTDTPSALMPHVRSGKIKALAVFSNKRVPGVTEVPTIAEAGGPAIEGSTWVLFLAPAATPREIVNRMSAETAKAINTPEMKARFESLGIEPGGTTPEQAAKFLDDEIAKWAKVIAAAGVKAE
ncbi:MULTISPECIES: tripartite tricarboxylate transporter substrate binding protein [unclassified Limnohabitans]|jgi:tripartite-type tricarboxylate transporter receptor subunit TctC|uniref:Bug family tripartite tricarboxylate transporter substrate binding protein n=1 Tax=unclassified Limnohabitans TaxID=2626134 RepID=UPI001E5C5B97|nr:MULTISPECIES: tripartite tricarboxylate transporter substrate binding protein [unclassified Limnohabitans]